MGKDEIMHFGPYKVKISNKDKVIFPKHQLTKADILAYYLGISDKILPWLKDRPLTLHRFPDGVASSGFYQKNAADYFPEWLPTFETEKENGETIVMPMINKKADLAYLANQGSIVFHTWLSKQQKPELPDKVIFDLDPAEDVSFNKVILTAERLKDFLMDKMKATVFVMSSGSNGLHIHLPIKVKYTFEALKPFVKLLAEDFADQYPEDYTTEIRKDKRKGRIFIDYLRNSAAQTTVCPYALRATANATIAMPLAWESIKDKNFDPASYNLTNYKDIQELKEEPWKAYGENRSDLSTYIRT